MEAVFEKILKWISMPFFYVGQAPVTLGGIATAFLILFGAFVVSAFVRATFLNRLSKKFKLNSGVAYAMSRIIHYGIIVLGLMISVQCVGLNLGSLAVVFGFLSVGVGFGLQNVASNFISGLILLLERPIAIGDFISVEDKIGKVVQINMRSTLINTPDNVSIIVPNSKFIENQVTNWSYLDPKVRVHCPVGVAYGSDVALVREVLLQVARSNAAILKTPEPEVSFLSFGESSLDFELLVWIQNPEDQRDILSEINYAIEEAFRKNNISIPFPQRDLHLQLTPAVEKLAFRN